MRRVRSPAGRQIMIVKKQPEWAVDENGDGSGLRYHAEDTRLQWAAMYVDGCGWPCLRPKRGTRFPALWGLRLEA